MNRSDRRRQSRFHRQLQMQHDKFVAQLVRKFDDEKKISGNMLTLFRDKATGLEYLVIKGTGTGYRLTARLTRVGPAVELHMAAEPGDWSEVLPKSDLEASEQMEFGKYEKNGRE